MGCMLHRSKQLPLLVRNWSDGFLSVILSAIFCPQFFVCLFARLFFVSARILLAERVSFRSFNMLFFTDKGGNKSCGTTTAPSSSPSKWPGVRLLLSLLATENKDNSTKLRILLGEACVAVYLSLLALAWSNSESKQLYRLVVNSLKAGMWGRVFGGGLRSAVQENTGK